MRGGRVLQVMTPRSLVVRSCLLTALLRSEQIEAIEIDMTQEADEIEFARQLEREWPQTGRQDSNSPRDSF